MLKHFAGMNDFNAHNDVAKGWRDARVVGSQWPFAERDWSSAEHLDGCMETSARS